MKRTGRRALLSGLCVAGISCAAVAADVPGHARLSALPSCAGATWTDTCIVDVANGDFAGPAGDPYNHGEFSWWSVHPGTHSIRAHLAPWHYATSSNAAWLDGPASGTSLMLRSPGDRVSQRYALKDILPAGTRGDVRYTLHAHARGDIDIADAAIGLFLTDGTSTVDRSIRYEAVSRGVGAPRQEVLASLIVPATQARTGVLYIAAGAAKGGRAPVVVDDVFLVRSPADAMLAELNPDG
ncbi:MAG: hypothetical protein GAK28_00287 [Luteibacter sp.]|uniref:hypothetical protein n=1 Tax=Luteibacter sp. TaxID=1886636 RepID=UPI001385DC71|nr:hypothetical protein [Luteibacter sp.]KAF1009647.1 MAG: hypothetical protein GAK28_00287 [Luteibacter sp.]